jgi:hypothetical protein
VVAFGLLSIMVSIFFNLIPSSTLATRRAENRLSASNIAQNRLEELRAAPFDTLAAADGNVEEVQRGSTTFTLTTTVSNLSEPDSNPNHILQVKVKVTWPERMKDQSLDYELRIFNQNR